MTKHGKIGFFFRKFLKSFKWIVETTSREFHLEKEINFKPDIKEFIKVLTEDD